MRAAEWPLWIEPLNGDGPPARELRLGFDTAGTTFGDSGPRLRERRRDGHPCHGGAQAVPGPPALTTRRSGPSATSSLHSDRTPHRRHEAERSFDITHGCRGDTCAGRSPRRSGRSRRCFRGRGRAVDPRPTEVAQGICRRWVGDQGLRGRLMMWIGPGLTSLLVSTATRWPTRSGPSASRRVNWSMRSTVAGAAGRMSGMAAPCLEPRSCDDRRTDAVNLDEAGLGRLCSHAVGVPEVVERRSRRQNQDSTARLFAAIVSKTASLAD